MFPRKTSKSSHLRDVVKQNIGLVFSIDWLFVSAKTDCGRGIWGGLEGLIDNH